MPSITPDNLIPDILAQFPACRAVLDKYGMRGCGGPLGPHETVRFFAEAHGVNTGQLLRELNAAARSLQNASSVQTYTETTADRIYRPFFKTAILVTLTAGCTWGAVNLFHIGRRSNFCAVPLDWTLAHAHAQIAGWVGLFIMGFALQAFPRFRSCC